MGIVCSYIKVKCSNRKGFVCNNPFVVKSGKACFNEKTFNEAHKDNLELKTPIAKEVKIEHIKPLVVEKIKQEKVIKKTKQEAVEVVVEEIKQEHVEKPAKKIKQECIEPVIQKEVKPIQINEKDWRPYELLKPMICFDFANMKTGNVINIMQFLYLAKKSFRQELISHGVLKSLGDEKTVIDSFEKRLSDELHLAVEAWENIKNLRQIKEIERAKALSKKNE